MIVWRTQFLLYLDVYDRSKRLFWFVVTFCLYTIPIPNPLKFEIRINGSEACTFVRTCSFRCQRKMCRRSVHPSVSVVTLSYLYTAHDMTITMAVWLYSIIVIIREWAGCCCRCCLPLAFHCLKWQKQSYKYGIFHERAYMNEWLLEAIQNSTVHYSTVQYNDNCQLKSDTHCTVYI